MSGSGGDDLNAPGFGRGGVEFTCLSSAIDDTCFLNEFGNGTFEHLRNWLDLALSMIDSC